jgi:hypothetical protein
VICLLVLIDDAFIYFLNALLYTILTSMPLTCAIAIACPFLIVLCNISVLITLSTLIDLTLLKEGLAMIVNLS